MDTAEVESNFRPRPGACGPVLRLVVCLFWIAAPALAFPTYAASQGAATVSAVYDISFSGVRIGKFNFHSSIAGAKYTLVSNAKVKVLFGAFRWRSASKTNGIIKKAPWPQTFVYRSKYKKKAKLTEMRFARGSVVELNNQPPLKPSKRRVPLEARHLIGVVDPMTAVMLMTRASSAAPCSQTIEVFEGRMRLRLELSPKGRRPIKEASPSGQPGFGHVCGVKFKPIAGYKRGRAINFITNNKGIEIVLRPVPDAGILVPYQVRVPTIVGSVVISARNINIVSRSNRRIALSH